MEPFIMDVNAISTVWSFFSWMPKFILKQVFTQEKLSGLIMFDVRPRYEYARVDLADISRFTIWLQVTNLAPVSVEMDRAEIEFNCVGTRLKAQILKRDQIESGETKEYCIDESIEKSEADQIARMIGKNRSSIKANIEFNCPLHNFSKDTGLLEGVMPVFINANQRIDR